MTVPTMPAEQPESVVVPREPTEAMTIAGVQAWSDGDDAPPVSTIYRAMLAAAPRQPQGAEVVEALSADDAWQELLDVDDRNSPPEYPEMCLIRFDELSDFMARATPQPVQPAPVGRELAKAAALLDRMDQCLVAAQHGDPNGRATAKVQDEARAFLAALSQPAPEAGEAG